MKWSSSKRGGGGVRVASPPRHYRTLPNSPAPSPTSSTPSLPFLFSLVSFLPWPLILFTFFLFLSFSPFFRLYFFLFFGLFSFGGQCPSSNPSFPYPSLSLSPIPSIFNFFLSFSPFPLISPFFASPLPFGVLRPYVRPKGIKRCAKMRMNGGPINKKNLKKEDQCESKAMS